MSSYDVIETDRGLIKMWTRGVPVEDGAKTQLKNIAELPFIHSHVAAMPDVHFGRGATVGSVIATKGAIIPAAVGVDIGCGMMAAQTTLTADQLPDSLATLRSAIEKAVPHGNGRGGNWGNVPDRAANRFRESGLAQSLEDLRAKHPRLEKAKALPQLGTLGGGNHFLEVCLDEADRVWVMLHSGSRGIGNLIGRMFIELARRSIEKRFLDHYLPDKDLSYFVQGEDDLFDAYVDAVGWAQAYAAMNREIMMERTLHVMRGLLPPFKTAKTAINCHHNYVERENHFGKNVWVTRKGAVRAREGDLGIIPGSMGERSFIVRGKGNAHSFESCSHGAGRVMSRTEAKRRFTVEDHVRATEGVECRKDASVIDETPAAYKDIDAVMAAQADLVDIVHTLKQVLCVKG